MQHLETWVERRWLVVLTLPKAPTVLVGGLFFSVEHPMERDFFAAVRGSLEKVPVRVRFGLIFQRADGPSDLTSPSAPG